MATHIALALMLFVAQGAYAVHPLLHDHGQAHQCSAHCPASTASASLEEVQAADNHSEHCPICDWLANFHGGRLAHVAGPPRPACLPEPVLAGGERALAQPTAYGFLSRGPPAAPLS